MYPKHDADLHEATHLTLCLKVHGGKKGIVALPHSCEDKTRRVDQTPG